MTTSLLNGAQGAPIPDYMKGVAEEATFGAGMDGDSFPRLVFKGSRFRLRQGDEETVLKETELEVVILQDFPAISRIFFDSGYDPEGGGRPVCASADGEAPLPNASAPQATTCATCPQNQKGSAITDDGRKSRACSFYKRTVMLVKGYEDVGPVVCDVKAMSLFGESRPNDDLWTLKAYFRRLASNNCKPFQLWTQMSFDVDSSVPMVLFRAVGWVDEAGFTDHVTPLVGTPDGRDVLELMVDTTKVRTGEDDGAEAPAGMLAQDKPAHLAAPAEPAQEESETAATEDPAAAEAAKRSASAKKAAITRAANKVKRDAEKAMAAAGVAVVPEENAEPDHPKFCPDCGSPWFKCEHTAKQPLAPVEQVAPPVPAPVAATGGDASDLEKAMKDFGF